MSFVAPAALPCAIIIFAILFACWLANRKWVTVDVTVGILVCFLVLVVVGPMLAYVFLK